MDVIGQNHHGIDVEGKALSRSTHRFPQGIDVLDKQAAVSVE
jgi:hypothetical protein